MLGERTLKRAAHWVLDRESIRRESVERELEAIMGFPGQFRRHRDFEFQLLKRMELRSDHRVLDVGCGPLTLGKPLIEFLEPGAYVGVDVRPLALAAAYREVCDHGLVAKNPRLLCSTTFGADELGDRRFDRVCAFSMLFHLDDSLLRNFFGLLSKRLRPGGSFLANVNVDMDPSTWEEFPFVQRPLSFYEQCAEENGLDFETLGRGREIGYPHEDAMSENYFVVVRPARVASGARRSSLASVLPEPTG